MPPGVSPSRRSARRSSATLPRTWAQAGLRVRRGVGAGAPISLYLPTSRYISLHLADISLYLPISAYISLDPHSTVGSVVGSEKVLTATTAEATTSSEAYLVRVKGSGEGEG